MNESRLILFLFSLLWHNFNGTWAVNERLAATTMAQFQWDLHIVCNVVDIASMVEQIAELYA